MERWVSRVALVTGASVGIGAAISTELVRHGLIVVGCGRNLDKLQEFGKNLKDKNFPGEFHSIRCDVGKEEDVLAMFRTIKQQHGGVDICINNAGLSYDSPVLTGSTERWAEMFNTNVLGLCMCTREAVKSMRDRKVDDGHIVNLCSMSGHRPMNQPDSSVYSATNCAVKSITDGVRVELKRIKSNIRISEVSPGITASEFFARKSGEERARQILSSAKFLEPKDIADSIVYALSAPARVEIHDILIRSTEQKT